MVAFPVPLIGVTLVSHAGLGFGRVMVQAPLQLIVKVPFPGTDGMEMDSGVTVTVAVGVGVGVGVGLYSFSPPPSQEAPAVTVTVPLLLPLAGDTVYPEDALAVQATFDEMLMVPDAPPARVKVVGDTLKDSVTSGVGVGFVPPFSPPPQEVAAKEIIPDATSIAQSLCSLKNFLIFNRF